ncbi:hypothetical protein KO493_01105 [Tamlana agarivorans]|uniref:Uncharacterized protein n=1 Tax=Pseudotamlana agarivorans TaxID=481183 RepID=A0ACC5U4W5_9FLAO|nr:hypothetical protein [Tamlana agarivorans]MBU2949294.1 hypothetical protein [Tamlana agarivorans]
MTFQYDSGATAHLKSSLLEDLPTEATFKFENAMVKINGMFHQPSTVTIITKNHKKTYNFNYKSIGYNYETIHFNELLRQGKTESDIMTFNFSEQLINTLDKVRALINLNY